MLFTKNFHQLQTEVSAHVAADQVEQGNYKTCFIGCLARGKDSPEFIESEYGIPLEVSRIAESIFEALPPYEAPLFFAALPDAIQCNGKDLSRVVWQFLAEELRSLPPVTPGAQEVINPVIDGMDLLAQGKKWPEEDARASVRAVASWVDGWDAWAASAVADAANAADLTASDCDYLAAELAARAADWAAKAAASSYDARPYQRDLLLKLIKEAPITQQQQQENN